MKKILFSTLLSVAVMTTLPSLNAQITSSGAFTVTATIEPCISLTFVSDGSGKALASGSGSGTAALDFGNIQAYGYTPPTGVTQALVGSGASATAFTVSTPFDVLVMQANTISTSYTLSAALNATDANDTWSVGGHAVPSTTPVQITALGTYASATSYAVLLTVPFANNASTGLLAVSNTINFVATAN
jgi:hypothetical protein